MASLKPLVIDPADAIPVQRLQDADDLDLSANGLAVGEDVTIGGTLDVTGDTTLTSATVSVLLTAEDILVLDDLTVVGDVGISGSVQIGGTLAVVGIIVGLSGASIDGFVMVNRNVTNTSASEIPAGSAVRLTGEDEVQLAQADSASTTQILGLAAEDIAATSPPGDVRVGGILELTTGEWDAITGESGGLTPLATYFLSPAVAGGLTQTRPTSSSHFIVKVGVAISDTIMLLYPFVVEPSGQLTGDLTIYVRTTGDDDTGDGTSGNPYLTIHRASEHYVQLIPGNFTITINLGDEIHEVDEIFSVAYPYAGQLTWQGDYESVATPTISAIDASVTGGSSPYGDLEFLDFDLDLAAASTSPAVGQFVRLTGCTGGTNPDGLNGLHEIVAVASDVATCRVWRRAGTTELPSGAITVASALLLKTVLHFTADDHGIDMKGPIDMGNWDGVVLRGNDTAVGSSKRAIRLFNGAGIRGATLTGDTAGLYVHEWAVAYEVVGGSVAYLLRSGTSKITSTGMSADIHSTILATGTSTFNGIVGVTLQASNNSTIVATGAVIQGVNTAGAGVPVLAQTVGLVNVASARIHYDQGAGTAILARDMGRVHEEGATIVGFATDYSPTADTFGNGGAYINTA